MPLLRLLLTPGSSNMLLLAPGSSGRLLLPTTTDPQLSLLCGVVCMRADNLLPLWAPPPMLVLLWHVLT
jgi:hypothetical protein